jgi:hypothetical protein
VSEELIVASDKEIFVNSTDNSPSPRTPLHIGVSFRKSYAREETTGTLKNISLTGAFLSHTTGTLGAGEKLHMTFNVAGRERDLHALVVWTNSFGSGVKFLPQNNRDVQIVDDLIYFVESKRTGTRDVLDSIFKKVG